MERPPKLHAVRTPPEGSYEEPLDSGLFGVTGFGVTTYIGAGWTLHWSSEEGWQIERAHHRTLRLGMVFAIRRRPRTYGT